MHATIPAMLLALTVLAMPWRVAAEDVLVFAAASLRDALVEIAAGWDGGTVSASHAASSALARQIEQGAPADLFISADVAWMDHLAARGAIHPQTRRDLLGNRLVLIGHWRGAAPVALDAQPDLAGLLGEGRLAMANVTAVPAGRYGRAALEALGLWPDVHDRLAEAENVRAALALVARGEAPLGIVYATDAAAEDRVTVLGTFPSGSHPAIVYPVAVTSQSTNPRAEAFVAYLLSDKARAAFERHGFTVPD